MKMRVDKKKEFLRGEQSSATLVESILDAVKLAALDATPKKKRD